jgi:transcriptional regulator with XRE-family HTH domain
MAKAHLPKSWGTTLAKLRQDAQLTGAEVARQLERLGIHLDRASVYAYEAGRVSAPDAGVIWGLARIYGVSVEGLITALVRSRTGRAGELPKDDGAHPTGGFDLSDEERELVQEWRKLTHQGRRACREFVSFQLTTRERKPRAIRREE